VSGVSRKTDVNQSGLGRNKLAKRLGVSGPTITKYQQQGRMEELSLKYDPDGTVWHYDPASKLFTPQQ
jgi:transposase